MRIAMLHTRLRVEERLLLEGFERAGVLVDCVDLREVVFDLADAGRFSASGLVLDRSLSLSSSLAAVRILERFGVRCVNPGSTIEVAGDKLRTSLALERGGVATPRVRVACSPDAAIDAVESLGYPAVIKPAIGSWGRLIARVNDRDAAEAVIEHRTTLGGAGDSVIYVQEHIEKSGEDLRVFVIGGEPVACIRRRSDHWITNTARGGRAEGVAIGPDLDRLCRAAWACVGGDLLAVDVMECPRRGPVVNEVNHSMEFRNSIETTGVDIPGLIVEHVRRVAQGGEGLADRAPEPCVNVCGGGA